jgi:hypothetical protein
MLRHESPRLFENLVDLRLMAEIHGLGNHPAHIGDLPLRGTLTVPYRKHGLRAKTALSARMVPCVGPCQHPLLAG